MASIIGVETLQHTNGTTAATIDSSGNLIPSASGSVLQVKSKVITTDAYVQTTSSTYVTTGYSIDIQPKKADSKILIEFSFHADADIAYRSKFTIYRDSTDLKPSNQDAIARIHASGRLLCNIPCRIVDEPSTTNNITYTLYMGAESSSTTRVRTDITPTVITATEIAG